MKKLLFTIIFLSNLGVTLVFSQPNKQEKVYIEILEIVLSKNIFDIDKMMVVFEQDSCIFYNSYENFIEDTEKRLEFKFNEYSVKVWPGDHVFFFDIENSIKITKFEVTENTAKLIIELCVNRRTSKGFEIFLIKAKESWEIKKAKERIYDEKYYWE